MAMLAGRKPDNLGVRDGRLAPCRATPNCVSSQADARTDPGHYVEPLARASWSALRQLLATLPRVQIVEERPRYLRAEFTSRLLGFVDDVEFYHDETAGLVHVRSASRLGSKDFGVNRRRIEDIRRRLG
jgi:uncharacterized protein (DUF1499 family)